MERGLVVFALFLLIFTVVEFAAYDYFSSIREFRQTSLAEIADSRGDVRARSTRHEQSVFSGADSKAKLRFNRSEIDLDANSQILIHKVRGVTHFNLKYGSFTGTIAKGERIAIENEVRDTVEMKSTEESKIAIHREKGSIVFEVLDGSIQIAKDHKIHSLASRDRTRFANHRKIEIHPLVFTAPKFAAHYSHDASEEMEFSWRNEELTGPFVFEISDSPSFKNVSTTVKTSEAKAFVTLNFPRVVYYRVKDAQGNYSEIRRLSLLNPNAPAVAFRASKNRQSILNLKLTPESRVTVQIARDPHFQQIFVTRSGVESNYGFELPAGKYFARARLEYRQFNRDFTQMTSPWSEARALSIP